jgi:hypothetical protein
VYSGEEGGVSIYDMKHVWHDRLIYVLAGPAAEAKARNPGSSRFVVKGDDRREANRWIGASGRESIHFERRYRRLARLFVDGHWPQIEAVAKALVERRGLYAGDVRRLIREARR